MSAVQEDAPRPGGNGNAARSRSKRTRRRQPGPLPPVAPPQGAAGAASTGAPATGAGAAGAGAGQGRPEQGGESGLLPILNWLAFFFLMQNFVGPMVARFTHRGDVNAPGAVPDAPPPSSDGVFPDDAADGAAVGAGRQRGKPLGATGRPYHRGAVNDKMMKPSCLWKRGTVMDLDVTVTDSPRVPRGWPPLTTPIDDDPAYEGEGTVLASWRQEGLVLGGVPGEEGGRPAILSFFSSNADQEMNRRNTTLDIPMTPAVRNNETHVYAHVRLQRRSHLGEGLARSDDVLVKRTALTRHRRRKRSRDVKSLLEASEGTDDPPPPESDPNDLSVLTAASLNRTHDQVLLYLKPSLTLQIVDVGPVDFPTREAVPRAFSDHMDWYRGEGDVVDPLTDLYYPILYSSEFWITYASLREVNGTLAGGRLDVSLEPVPMWKWQLQSQTEDNWRRQEAFTGEEDAGNDVLREMLLDTNPYLLAVTAIVSVLHTLFDVLAFKNDISFFKNKKSMEGLSLRSMIVNAGFSLVILLYLADNETSYMVLMSNGVGLAIEVWKISKAVTVKFEGGKIEWVEAQSYKKSKTKEYDEVATSHLLFVTMPLVAGYGVYSLFHQKHKGWYSWMLNTLVGFIYMFGFVMMTPQLFINYKLQSVAHLNWRTMTYKSINTFIDDLFAFVIKMPIMHRLACLRDDLIFFIYLFQRYKYRTDYTRVNEFGQCSQPTEEMLAEREQEIAAAADAPPGGASAPPAVKRRGARDKKSQ